MKILYINSGPAQTVSAYHRNILPAIHLRKRGHTVDFLPIQYFDYDIVVLSRYFASTFQEQIDMLHLLGAKIVYETDDFVIKIPSSHISYPLARKEAKTYYFLLKAADIITCTTPYLKSKIEKDTDKKVRVVPNSLDVSYWRERAGNNKKLRIGYAASDSHWQELDFILDVLIDLQKDYDFEVVFIGLGINSLKHAVHLPHCGRLAKSILNKLPKLKNLETTEWVPFYKYPQFLAKANLDIGLAPLIDNEFNRCRSCIKFYEYALVNTPTIASDVIPYNTELKFLAKNKFADWKNKIRLLMEDEKLRKNLAEEQREWVIKNRDIEDNVVLWENVFEEVLNEN
jgi:glycosyltransferase involved in cell wall biosynthesis